MKGGRVTPILIYKILPYFHPSEARSLNKIGITPYTKAQILEFTPSPEVRPVHTYDAYKFIPSPQSKCQSHKV